MKYQPTQTTPFTLKIKILNIVWQIINRTVFRVFPLRMKWSRIWLLRLFGARIASDVTISRTAIIDHPWNLEMGSLSSLGDNSWTYCLAKIKIGENCCVGQDVYLLTGSHDITDLYFSYVIKEIVIEDGCWIATGAYVLQGVRIGEYSVVGARSLVIKSCPPYSVLGGNPAKIIKNRVFLSK